MTLARAAILAATTTFAFLLLAAAAAAGVCTMLVGGLSSGAGSGSVDLADNAPSVVTCRINGGIHGSGLDLDPDQAANAAVINQVAAGLGITPKDRAVTIALATALQESDLHNLDHGTYDSLGLFQQRPSQGWGSPAEIMNPAHAAWQFYTHLARVPHWWQIPITAAAQAVQHSAYPGAYQAHAAQANALQQFLATHPDVCTTSNMNK